MKLSRAVHVLGLLPALVVPAVVAAQAPAAPACNLDQNKPRSVQNSTVKMLQLQGAQGAAKAKLLSDVVREVSSEKSKDNPAGQNYILAQALIGWAGEPNMSGVVPRGTLGYTTDPTATIDVLAAADSALRRIAEAAPGCAPQVAEMRQNQAWLNQINLAINAMNAGKADSAEYHANRSLVMFQGSPYAYHVLSVVASNKDDAAAATRHWTKVIEVAGADTTYRDIRNSAMFNIAAAKAQQAEAATGDQQKALARDAAAALQAYLAAAPTSPDAPRAQPMLARMLLLTGDKAALRGTYADALANPEKYSDLALTQSGVFASQANDTVSAAKLFEAAIAQNPYSRDALNNLSATLLQLKQFDKIIPVARRLVAIDPSNGDNYAFLSLAYNGLATSAAAGAKKALNDSAFKYYQQSEQMPVRVTFTEFTRGESRAVVGLQIEGLSVAPPAPTPARAGAARAGARAAAAKPAAPAPKTYEVKLEFLDKNGNVLDAQTQSVGPVGPGDRKTARFETAKEGVASFRYAPLT